MHSIKWIIFFCLSCVFAGCQFSEPSTIAPFTTDGCSDFPDGTHAHKDIWRKCCVTHDLKYWAGGSAEERMNADLELRACVRSVGEPAIAEMMLAGVRVGGSPWWPTRFRWGYGWPYGNGYSKLTPDEMAQVLRQKERQNLN